MRGWNADPMDKDYKDYSVYINDLLKSWPKREATLEIDKSTQPHLTSIKKDDL